MKILTFLGTGAYKPATYHWEEHSWETHLFPEALAQWKRPEEMLVLLTREAEAHEHWQKLQERLAGKTVLTPVRIPSGTSEAQLWQIFERLADSLSAGGEVLFDITHAFRSLPILALLAAAYLRLVKGIQLQALVYGAYEARELETNRAPVFDLTPFLRLLDWVTATDLFLKTGNGKDLAGLLPQGNDVTRELAQSIDAIAQGLHFLRPMVVLRESAALRGRIAAAVPHVSKEVPPFGALIHRVEQDYGRFGMDDPASTQQVAARASLVRQLEVIKWYAQKEEYVHALSLAREWLPSLLCYHFQLDSLEVGNREDMELLLAGGKLKDKEGTIIKESPRRSQWSTVPEGARLRNLWSGKEWNLAHLRNDVLHSGFRKNPRTPQEIKDQTERILAELVAIAALWKLEG
jgi:CRISPR-associated DxTHG motif protein